MWMSRPGKLSPKAFEILGISKLSDRHLLLLSKAPCKIRPTPSYKEQKCLSLLELVPPSFNQDESQRTLRHGARFGPTRRCSGSSRWVLPRATNDNPAADMLVVGNAEAGSVYIPNEDGTEDVAELW